MTEGEIKRAAAKRRLVGGLVYHHEQECDKVTLDDDQRQRPDDSVSRRDQPDQRADNDNDAVVAGRTDQTLPIGPHRANGGRAAAHFNEGEQAPFRGRRVPAWSLSVQLLTMVVPRFSLIS